MGSSAAPMSPTVCVPAGSVANQPWSARGRAASVGCTLLPGVAHDGTVPNVRAQASRFSASVS